MLTSLGRCTLLLFNQGLHVDVDIGRFKEDNSQYLSRFSTIAALTGLIPLYRETYAQHFPLYDDGRYELKKEHHFETCSKPKRSYTDITLALSELVEDFPLVQLVPTHIITLDWWVLHDNKDCTHNNCYSRLPWSSIWHSLLNTLKHYEGII
jgi:hypothetical protein